MRKVFFFSCGERKVSVVGFSLSWEAFKAKIYVEALSLKSLFLKSDPFSNFSSISFVEVEGKQLDLPSEKGWKRLKRLRNVTAKKFPSLTIFPFHSRDLSIHFLPKQHFMLCMLENFIFFAWAQHKNAFSIKTSGVSISRNRQHFLRNFSVSLFNNRHIYWIQMWSEKE